jgi:pyruvate/2-oxoglutarate dehydrogenase complex dihydrolipoamide acyltransferase (E2) component
MPAEIILPELGPAATGETAVLSLWLAEEGEEVLAGDRLVEVLVAGATFDVPAPASGILTEILAYPEDDLQPGQVLGLISETGEVDADDTEPDARTAADQ